MTPPSQQITKIYRSHRKTSWERDSGADTQSMISLLLRTEQTGTKLGPEQIYTSPPSDDSFRAEQIYTRFRQENPFISDPS